MLYHPTKLTEYEKPKGEDNLFEVDNFLREKKYPKRTYNYLNINFLNKFNIYVKRAVRENFL